MCAGIVLQFALCPISAFSDLKNTWTVFNIFLKGAAALSLCVLFLYAGYAESAAAYLMISADDFFLFPKVETHLRMSALRTAVDENKRLTQQMLQVQQQPPPEREQEQEQHDVSETVGDIADVENVENDINAIQRNDELVAVLNYVREWLTMSITPALDSGRWDDEERRFTGLLGSLVKPLWLHTLPPLHMVPVVASQVLFLEYAGYGDIDKHASLVSVLQLIPRFSCY
jgi:hypothetical protein